ncbi:MAG TPA: hypothetical protein VGL24_01560 [Chthoniobacterales bacterium]
MTKSTFLSNAVDGLRNTPRDPAPKKNRRPGIIGNLLALLMAVAFIGSADGVSATMKPEPSGLYDLLFGAPGTGKIDLTNNPLLDNPNIDGWRYKVGWAKIQPTDAATFNWASIDSAIAIAAAHGKKLCISIAGGLSVPDWVYTTAPVVYKYTMLETDSTTGASIGNQPLPWDTAYLDKWQTFLAAFAARYENNPACSYVVMGGFMENFNMTVVGIDSDFNAMENLAKNPPAGYPGLTTSYVDFSSAYIPAAQRVITDYSTYFPTTPLLVTLYKVVPGDLGITLQNTVSDWGKAIFPGHVGTMVSALYATVPPHSPPPAPLNYPKGFQMVCRAVDDPARLYIDPDPVPMPAAPTPLEDALEHAVSLGGKYVEVYEADLTPEISQPVLAAERAKLLANVGDGSGDTPPGPPAPPTNLHIVP